MTQIRFGLFETPLGVALLAATPRGLCALRLCRSHGPQEQWAEVGLEFAGAEMMEDAAALRPYADQLVAFLDGRTDAFRPPLDILSGTAFQRQVWAEVGRIPAGETISYTELAARVSRPSAVRAVAGACARNGLAVAIPCHRVRRHDGTLAGYRWGKEWKPRLLALEARMVRGG
ncbi:MAG: methylated-DNA--[protein]-cysteine S-methyltransferase [Armatimonadetes bacterium]|nr:methylated-DNA--[protein]-cysteine S-methyltransferase [Armatimonadota bacterium]